MWIEIHLKREKPGLLKNFVTDIHPMLQALIWGFTCYMLLTHHIKVVVTSLVRSEEENKRVGGSPTSKHREEYRMAVDFRTKDWPDGLVKIASDWLQKTWGDLLYILVESNHLHLHLRPHILKDLNCLQNK